MYHIQYEIQSGNYHGTGDMPVDAPSRVEALDIFLTWLHRMYEGEVELISCDVRPGRYNWPQAGADAGHE